jgi:hypothetical protein
MFAQSGRRFGRKSEPPFECRRLIGEGDAAQVYVTLRRRHVRVTGSRHQRTPASASAAVRARPRRLRTALYLTSQPVTLPGSKRPPSKPQKSGF